MGTRVCGASFLLLCLVSRVLSFTVRDNRHVHSYVEPAKENGLNDAEDRYTYLVERDDKDKDDKNDTPDSQYYPVDEATCTLTEISTVMMEGDNPPVLPPVGYLTNVGLELVTRDHLLFEVKTCQNALVVLTSTAVPLAYPGYRLQIKVPDDKDRLEVILGINEDEYTYVSKSVQKADKLTMDCNIFEKYFLTWSDKRVRFGVGWDYLEESDVVVKHNTDKDNLPKIRYAGVGSTQSDAEWRFCKDPLPDTNCGQADITFAVDLSMSMTQEMLDKYALGFVTKLVRRVKLGPQDVQFALVTYTASATVVFKLNESYDPEMIIEKTRVALRDRAYGTCSGCACEVTMSEVYDTAAGARPDISRIFIMLSDGINNDIEGNAQNGPSNNAGNLKDARIETYTLGLAGIGTVGLDTVTLKTLAYNPDTHYFTIEDENTLDETLMSIRTRLGCTGSTSVGEIDDD